MTRIRLVRLALVLLCAALLGACYTSDEPVIDKGEWGALAGTFDCKGMPGVNSMAQTERKSGFFFSDYTYVSASGEEIKLRKISGSLFVAQVIDAKKSIGYVFIDFIGDGQFVMLVPDVFSKGPYLEALLKKHGVTEGKSRGAAAPGLIPLGGSPKVILGFLMAHDKSLLSAVASCQRRK